MSIRVGVLAVTLAACANDYAGDGVAFSGAPGSGGLIHARFFEHTNCAANASGEVRCFSSCNPTVYGMGDDLATIDRVDVPTVACDGALDEDGNVAIIAEQGIVAMPPDGTFAIIGVVPKQLLRGHGELAVVTDDNELLVYDESGAKRWIASGVAQIAMRSDGGILAAGPSGATAYAPDGTQLWTEPGDVQSIAAGPGDEIATITTTVLAMHERDGTLRWSRTTEAARNITFHLATDGTDLFVAGDGPFDSIAGGYPGGVSRQSQDGLVWATPVLGWAPKVRILALADDAVIIQASVMAGSTDQDRYVPADHAVTGVGSAVLETEGAGQLIAKIGR